jgi:hypothetical protein
VPSSPMLGRSRVVRVRADPALGVTTAGLGRLLPDDGLVDRGPSEDLAGESPAASRFLKRWFAEFPRCARESGRYDTQSVNQVSTTAHV